MLNIIADNPKLFEEVTQLFDKHFAINALDEKTPLEGMDDAVLGQAVRARISGLKILRKAYAEILSHKTLSETPREVNPAR